MSESDRGSNSRTFSNLLAQDHRIHMSESDFVGMTRNGALCNEAGEIGAREFESIMRGEIVTYLQARDRADPPSSTELVDRS
jgi:hypothetical protein